jgi:hypothetical protein
MSVGVMQAPVARTVRATASRLGARTSRPVPTADSVTAAAKRYCSGIRQFLAPYQRPPAQLPTAAPARMRPASERCPCALA